MLSLTGAWDEAMVPPATPCAPRGGSDPLAMNPTLRRRARATCAIAACGALAACYTSVGKWTYPSGRYPTTSCERKAPAVVAVEPFLDLRPDTNRSWMTWAYVPLSPGGWTHFDRPEATIADPDTTQYLATPCEDLAKAIVVELRRTGMVERAVYSADGAFNANHTHVLRGKLRAFYVYERRWSYGLSIYGYIMWGLGLPMGTSDNGFCVDLELLDNKNGRVVWQGSIFDADSHVEGLYYGPEWYRFSWLWERRLRQKLGELATVLGTEPAPLPANLVEEVDLLPAAMPRCLGVDASVPCTER